MERAILPSHPIEARRNRQFRRAALLRRALQHRRGEHDVLRPAAGRGHARLGRAHAVRLRVLAEAVSEVHPSEDVPRGSSQTRSRRRGHLLDLLAQVTQADIDEFRSGIEPLAESGRLGALLAQFPASFKDTPDSREYLAQLLQMFDDYPTAIELRHKSWSDAVGDTLAMLNAFGAAWVQIDEPKFRFSIRQNYLPNVKTFYYMRLHGRNAEQWWRHDASEDRYNYLYSRRELQEFADIAGAAKALVRKSYLYTNNHFASKSAVNALMLKAQLGEPIDGEYPPELIERYSELEDLVSRGRLKAAATSTSRWPA